MNDQHQEELKLNDNSIESLTLDDKKSKTRSNFWYWIIPLSIVGALGGGYRLWIYAPPSTANTSTVATIPPRPVEIITVIRGKATQEIKLLGQVEAGEKATVRSQLSGTVEEIKVKEGDRVTSGMVIAVLDGVDSQIAVAEAQAKLAQAKGDLDKLKVGTRPEIIAQRQAELESAQTREKEAQENLDSLIRLQPDLIAQRQAELKSTLAREKEAEDNLRRIKSLTEEGAISERVLVEAQSNRDTAKSERLRAESALKAQETQSRQEISLARTRLDNTRSERNRINASLAEAQAGATIEEISAQQGVVQAAEAILKQAQLGLTRTEITAPFDGIIDTRNVNQGDYLQVNTPVATIVGDRTLDIFLEVPENLSGQIGTGTPISLTARALPQWQQNTVISGVVPTTNTSSRRQLVRVTLNNPPQGLMTGMAIQGDVKLDSNTAEGLIIPRDALTRRNNRWFVFAVENNIARQLEIPEITDLGEKVVINHPNLKEGDSIVLRGGDGLQDESPIKIVNEQV